MAIIRLKINEKSKAGRNFMLFLKQFIKNNTKAIEVVREPNAETMQALEDSRQGKNMIKAKNAEDLIRKLNV